LQKAFCRKRFAESVLQKAFCRKRFAEAFCAFLKKTSYSFFKKTSYSLARIKSGLSSKNGRRPQNA
jgi:hypothetical protein